MQGWNPSTRQHNFKELSFICDAEKACEIILNNNEIDDRKITMCQKDRLLYSRAKGTTLLYDSLSFL